MDYEKNMNKPKVYMGINFMSIFMLLFAIIGLIIFIVEIQNLTYKIWIIFSVSILLGIMGANAIIRRDVLVVRDSNLVFKGFAPFKIPIPLKTIYNVDIDRKNRKPLVIIYYIGTNGRKGKLFILGSIFNTDFENLEHWINSIISINKSGMEGQETF